ncbi:MAG TPA: cation diffusion facilitator family transporter [Gemmatimonadales bacterium]|nr:cation diffusion facilitator family transporter [Gemmatimonadales bacterium]
MSGARPDGRDRAAAIRRVLLGLLTANLAVVGAKVVIGIKANSLSVLGDAVHSSVDALNNVIFLALMRVASRAPDHDHPYGHGKFEILGAVAIVIFLSVSCFELLTGAVRRLLAGGRPPALESLDLALLLGTLVANVWVAWYETRRGRQLDSDLLLADAAHTRADVIITLGVIASGVLSQRGIPYVDPIAALLVTIVIARIGWQIVRRAVPILVDEVAREPDQIRRAAEAVEGVHSAYRIKSRSSSGLVFAELTIGVRGSLAVERAHEIADAVEATLRRDLKLDEVVVHIEPC